jgi:hypothetical protein
MGGKTNESIRGGEENNGMRLAREPGAGSRERGKRERGARIVVKIPK